MNTLSFYKLTQVATAKLRYWLLIFLLLHTFFASANHLVGMDLQYTYITGTTYKITLTAYADCGARGSTSAYTSLPFNQPEIHIYNGGTFVSTILLDIEPPIGVEITPVCPADLLRTQCTDVSFTTPGITRFVYSKVYTLPGYSPMWRFMFTGDMTGSIAGRALSITNIASVSYIQLIDTLNNVIGTNNSPRLTNIPTPYFCNFSAETYNPGAVDPDGDGLQFDLVSGMAGSTTSTPGGPVTYLGSYTGISPLAVASMSFDRSTGQISFYPNALQRSLVVYNIREFRGGICIGSCQREMTFLVQPCTSSPPRGGMSAATAGVIDDSTHFRICNNSGAYTFNVNPTQADTTNLITVTYAGLPAGATMTITGNGTRRPRCLFSWTSTGVAPGAYTFYMTFTDNNCPLSGTQTFAYTVTVLPSPSISQSLVSPVNCFARAAVRLTPGDAGSPWVVKVSRSGFGDTIHTFTGITAPLIDSLLPGSYFATVHSAVPGGCRVTIPFTITSLSAIAATFTYSHPTYCGASDGSIIISGLTPAEMDTIRYQYNGIWQTPVVATVGSDGRVTMSGLLAGIYSNITVSVGRFCTTNTLGPITLSNPAFRIRAISKVDPEYCGICNGSITLYGLIPGQTDTITYSLHGVPQPPVVRLIGADSMVTISGLCSGTYSGFTARTGGVCISNTVGPVTLTVPLFLMRGLTKTNPDYCGICDGTITLLGLHPGNLDTIFYTKDGIAQPPIRRLIGADSTATLTGLCAGVYDSFVARTGGICVTNMVGPAILTVPSFTVGGIRFRQPDYCGIGNGSITLYGLHPGTTDTITYYKDGIPQPPVVRLIMPDSVVVISGLCEGLYSHFVVRTGGVCVSDTLGPVLLTVPPFTMRAITYTYPDYCGTCNGTITLHGLHPGNTDTFYYTKDGLPQPPFVRIIGADSLAVLTGLCPGTYDSFISRTGGICVSNMLGPVTLTVPPFTMRTISRINPDYCGTCDGTITLYGLYPGSVDTIFYRKDGIVQPMVIRTIGADSLVVITGLCQGVYDSFAARTGGICVSNILGPVSLTVPSFTIRSLSFVNPDYCGTCNGTITIHGLYPGLLDTINYELDGVPQPPIVRIVGSDSAITISGLCQGLYDQFIARTGGVCVSNVLGPVTLTVPPFTMRAISHTNPEYCGSCNGTITLYGLYPGQIDTIYYDLDGVPQTPIVRLIPADSTVRLTGLCHGVYDRFVARTGGVCVSNMLGPVSLTIPPFVIRSISHTNADYCGICNGTITLYGLHPGDRDTITYTRGGVPQTPIIVTIAADSMVRITGLCGGLYDNFVARTGGNCVSNAVGPVNLYVPPFRMRVLRFTNPTKCGYCDGTITLDGLYPGQTDTINYTFNGIAQPPIVQLIGADSSVRLTGLCQGVYAGFVANTGGECVSNILGPATLVAPPIVPAFSSRMVKTCDADTVFFTNTSSPSSDLTYRWHFGDSTTTASISPIHVYTLPGNYTVKLVISNGHCTDSVQQISVVDNIVIAGFKVVPDSFLCQGLPATFTNISLGMGLRYRWYFGDGTTETEASPVHTYRKAGKYKAILAVSNAAPCYDTAVWALEVDSLSGITIKATDTVLCGGSDATFTALYHPQGSQGITWSISDGFSVSNINPLMYGFGSGSYTIRVAASYRACPDTGTMRTIFVGQVPVLSIGEDTSVCPGGQPIVLIDRANEKNPNARWRWNTGETTAQKLIIEPGKYYVTVNIGGCTASDSILVVKDCYMDVPNVFTPNGDGLNDYFFPRQLLSRGLSSFHMDIFNRWGTKVFETNQVDGKGWDGNLDGIPQPQGVFVFRIEATFIDGQQENHQGNVTLLR